MLLITKSGAEGMNTRNVRQVHVLEPFWHANRVEQVIGRAVRANSHAQLPPADRNVDVFVYMAVFQPEQAKISPKKDGGKTSDEFVHGVSQRKRKVLEGMLATMRAAAVDCNVHGYGNCYKPPPDAADPLRSVDVAVDIKALAAVRFVAVRVGGRLYYADQKTGELYDHAAMKRDGAAVRVAGRKIDPALLPKKVVSRK